MALANGNKTVTIPYADRRDEVGDTARAATAFKDNLLRVERLEVAQKQVEERTATERKSVMQARDAASKKTTRVVTVSSSSARIEGAANTLTKTASTTEQLSGLVATASDEASSNVQAVAFAAEELSASVSEVGRHVQESSRIAKDAVDQAARTDVRINELFQAASRIGDVVRLITDIAEQTNLLALNATIEAARAGGAGKGFAVVAQEVKALAAQTAKATSDIGTQISGMQTATRESVAAIKEIGETIDRVSEIATAMAAAVEEQGGAIQEIARNVQEAAPAPARLPPTSSTSTGRPPPARRRRRFSLGAVAGERQQSAASRCRNSSSWCARPGLFSELARQGAARAAGRPGRARISSFRCRVATDLQPHVRVRSARCSCRPRSPRRPRSRTG